MNKPKHPDAAEMPTHVALDEAQRLKAVAHKARDKADVAKLAVEVSQQATAKALLSAAEAEKEARQTEADAKAAADHSLECVRHELHVAPVAAVEPPKPTAPTVP